MSDISDKLLALARSLYPRGRAFKMPVGGFLESLHIALGLSEERFYNDAISILSDILPDNANFTSDDATDWERRLGLITNLSTSLSDRKLAIKNKLNQPGVNPAKQNWRYLQEQLQNAGFNVYIFENRFGSAGAYMTKTPIEVSGDSSIITAYEHGEFEHGELEHGGDYNNKVANNIDESKDRSFDFGSDFRSTFFIGGTPVGTFANVPLSRRDEFRQLILKTKPTQTIAFLFIHYI